MSNYSIREAQSEDIDEWDSIVESSEHGSIFHDFNWLKSIENEAGFKFVSLIIEKGGHGNVGVFPVFIKKRKGITIACSPPPGCAIPHLGPVFNYSSDNQYRKESEYRESIKIVIEYLENKSVDYFRFAFTPEFIDIRPFTWSGFSASVHYTYRMFLSGNDMNKINDGYDKKVRKMIRKFERAYPEAEVRETTIDNIVRQLKSRYDDKGREHSVSFDYFKSVGECMGKKVQPLGVFVKNEFVNGTVLLHHKKGALAWVGSPAVSSEYNGINEFLRNWIIGDLLEKNYNFFETVGANTEHLCEHKSRYNFRPVPYYVVEKMNGKAKLAKSAAKILGLSGRDI